MAKCVIGGVAYEVAPFGFKKLRKAAKHIDLVQALLAGINEDEPSMVDLTEVGQQVLEIVVIGVDDPAVTIDTLADSAKMSEIQALTGFFTEVMTEAAGGPEAAGEPAPPPLADPGSPQINSSTES